MAAGIYCISNTVNGKRYVGSAVNFKGRWQNHLSYLRRGEHSNRYLQRAFDKYGECTFAFSVLEQTDDVSQLIPREQWYLDMLLPEYNICRIAASSLGVRRTEETCAKLRGERNPMYGRHWNAEERAKMSEARIGERNHFYGKHHGDKAKQKMSIAWTLERRKEQSIRIAAINRARRKH